MISLVPHFSLVSLRNTLLSEEMHRLADSDTQAENEAVQYLVPHSCHSCALLLRSHRDRCTYSHSGSALLSSCLPPTGRDEHRNHHQHHDHDHAFPFHIHCTRGVHFIPFPGLFTLPPLLSSFWTLSVSLLQALLPVTGTASL